MSKIIDFVDIKKGTLVEKLPPRVDKNLYICCRNERCVLHKPADSWLAFSHIEHSKGCRQLRSTHPKD
jgi:hypothetical protein